MSRAIITGISGQDGRLLADFLLAKGYEVAGLTRDAARAGDSLGEKLSQKVELLETDISDQASVAAALDNFKPSEFYNLAALAKGSTMWDEPREISLVNGLAVTTMLEAIRESQLPVRFCQASSSEMFGTATVWPQNESTAFLPRSPYGAAKLYAHNMVGIYRDHHAMFSCSAILFNHESEYRNTEFVTGKIAHYAAGIKLGYYQELSLGNIEALRDWGYAGDYVRAMWMMLQHQTPMDFVISTGECYSVKRFCEIAFSLVGLDYADYLVTDSEAFRAGETVPLVGDNSRIQQVLGWKPELSIEELVRLMVECELDKFSRLQGKE